MEMHFEFEWIVFGKLEYGAAPAAQNVGTFGSKFCRPIDTEIARTIGKK